jgi:starch-binding outer membrane protein, SusD/RagB family
MQHSMNTHQWAALATVAAIGGLVACGDFLEVTNPGQIDADGLNDRAAIPGLVVGMSADLSYGLIAIANDGSIFSDEHRNGATGTGPTDRDNGQIRPDGSNAFWDRMHQARWVSETGIDRIRGILGDEFEGNSVAPRAHLYAGFSNRILGEYFCEAVIDGGPAEPHQVHFQRAEAQFTEARRLAQQQGEEEWAHAARAGLAQAFVGLERWDDAAAAAAAVPVDFVFEAIYSANSGRENNDIYHDTHRAASPRFTVHGTPWEEVTDDPRVPWEIDYHEGSDEPELTANRARPAYTQQKYTSLADNIALAKGTEMLLIRAEAALRRGDIAGATQLINEQRDHYELEPASVPESEGAAWTLLQQERGAVLWLEGRRLFDLRRWFEEGRHDFLTDRDRCIPISDREREANDNLS